MSLKPAFIVDPERAFLQIGEDWHFSATLIDDLQQSVAGATATITLKDAGNTVLLAATAMDEADGVITYTLDSAVVTTPRRHMKAEIAVTEGGNVWTYLHLVDAVRFSPRPTLSKNELAIHVANIGNLAPPTDPAHQGLIRDAWGDVLAWLRSLDVYPDLVIDQSELRRLHRCRALELLFGRNAMEESGMHEMQRRRWAEEYKQARDSAKLSIDANESGTVEEEEVRKSVNVVSFGRRVLRSELGPIGDPS